MNELQDTHNKCRHCGAHLWWDEDSEVYLSDPDEPYSNLCPKSGESKTLGHEQS